MPPPSPPCVASQPCIRATAIAASASFWLARDIAWGGSEPTDCGVAPGCNCRADVRVGGLRASRPRPQPARGPNQVWAYDFVHDACVNGQKLKCLTIIDEFTRECLAIDVAGSIRSARVIQVLSRPISMRGAPMFLRSDNGPEFVSHAILTWLSETKIESALIDPGKPWQNGTDESFNGKFRDECLNLEWFQNRTEARVLIDIYRRHYNHVRPHSSLNDRTPFEFREHCNSTHQGATLK